MIRFTQGNLLEAPAEALVNTVNTVGVMGKGIALMFKETFPENYRLYREACKTKNVKVGRVFATERRDFVSGQRWIINFPTKEHCRAPRGIEGIRDGLVDLRRFIEEHKIRSVALPQLGSGNGGIDWREVRPLIVEALEPLQDVTTIVYEPTKQYQNVQKREGVERLTPARALLAELVRRYWVLGIECTMLEVQKLAYFLERQINVRGLPNPLNLAFGANRFGPFSPNLRHLLDALDGSYLRCNKSLADAGPMDVIGYDDAKMEKVGLYIRTEAKPYQQALDAPGDLIERFESPLGMELLATVDWLLHQMPLEPTVDSIRAHLTECPAGQRAGPRQPNPYKPPMLHTALTRP